MKKFSIKLAMLALAMVLAVGLAFVGCDNGTTDNGGGSSTTRFEGSWFSRDPSSPISNYSCFTFHGNNYSFYDIYNGQPVPGRAMSGTFTFTDTVITLITSTGTTIPREYQWRGGTLSLQEFGDYEAPSTKFDGRWVNRTAASAGELCYYEFFGNRFVFRYESSSQGVTNMPGTFTFTDSEITFIPPGPNQWEGWTSGYRIEGDLFRVYTSYGPDGQFYRQ